MAENRDPRSSSARGRNEQGRPRQQQGQRPRQQAPRPRQQAQQAPRPRADLDKTQVKQRPIRLPESDGSERANGGQKARPAGQRPAGSGQRKRPANKGNQRQGQRPAERSRNGQSHRPQQGRPQQGRPQQTRRPKQARPTGSGSQQGAKAPAKGGRSQLPIGLFALVAAIIVVILVVVSVNRCSARRSAPDAGSSAQVAQGSSQTQEGSSEEGSAAEQAGVADDTYYVESVAAKSVMMALSAAGEGDDGYVSVIVSEEMDIPNQQIALKNNSDGKTCTFTTGTGLVLDCGDPSAGAGRELYAMKASDADSQKWVLVPVKGKDGEVDGYQIQTYDGSYAIQVEGTEFGDAVTLQEVDSSEPKQEFRFVTKKAVTSTLAQSKDLEDESSVSDGTDESSSSDDSEDYTDASDGYSYDSSYSEDYGYSDESGYSGESDYGYSDGYGYSDTSDYQDASYA